MFVNKGSFFSVAIVDESAARLDGSIRLHAALTLEMGVIEHCFKSEICSTRRGRLPNDGCFPGKSLLSRFGADEPQILTWVCQGACLAERRDSTAVGFRIVRVASPANISGLT